MLSIKSVFLPSVQSSCRVHAPSNTHARRTIERTAPATWCFHNKHNLSIVDGRVKSIGGGKGRDREGLLPPYTLRAHHVDEPLYGLDVYVPWDAARFTRKEMALLFRGSITPLVNRHRFPRTRFPGAFVLRSTGLFQSTREPIRSGLLDI